MTVSFGTMVEYYDVVVFIIFLPLISKSLFGGTGDQASMMKGYMVLFISALSRPIGALVFGAIGDFKGRAKALIASMYGIAIATLMLGLIPSAAYIGDAAVILMILAKSIQVFCYGGEFSGAGIYVMEDTHERHQGLMSSYLLAIAISGSLIAALLGVLLTQANMPDWSWRLAFIFGGLLGFIGIYFRKAMYEPANFQPASPKKDALFTLLKHYPISLLTGILIGASGSVPYTTVVAFINPLLMTKGLITAQQLMWLQTFSIAFSIIVTLVTGWLSTRIHPLKLMSLGCLLSIFFPLYIYLSQLHFMLLIMVISFGLIFLTEFFFAPAHAVYKDLFPMQFRYRGASLSFCLGISVIGGITPLIENFLYVTFDNVLVVFLWMLPISVGTLLCLNRQRMMVQVDAAKFRTLIKQP